LSSVVSLLIPRPPISTLFPYTTLFRSTHARNPQGAYGARELVKHSVDKLIITGELSMPGSGWPTDFHPITDFTGIAPAPRTSGKDRKSTRLNSSHVKISYAVFCLKKQR